MQKGQGMKGGQGIHGQKKNRIPGKEIHNCYIPGSWRWDLLLVDRAESDGSVRTLKE
jgi:hypothetical protein